jgi:hypothetical protein
MDEGNGGDYRVVRERALQEMELLLDAATTLRRDLEGHEARCREIIDGVRRGERLTTVLDEAASRMWRPRLTDSLTAYERLRHQARMRLIARGVTEGMTVTDVQYHWSITKQLANRSLREVEQLD